MNAAALLGAPVRRVGAIVVGQAFDPSHPGAQPRAEHAADAEAGQALFDAQRQHEAGIEREVGRRQSAGQEVAAQLALEVLELAAQLERRGGDLVLGLSPPPQARRDQTGLVYERAGGSYAYSTL
jgi:hypothetical protein